MVREAGKDRCWTLDERVEMRDGWGAGEIWRGACCEIIIRVPVAFTIVQAQVMKGHRLGASNLRFVSRNQRLQCCSEPARLV